MTFQPSSLKRLECCKVFRPEIYTGNKTKSDAVPSKRPLHQNSARTGCVPGPFTPRTPPRSPKCTHPAAVKSHYSFQSRQSLGCKDVHQPRVSPSIPQPESKTSLRFIHGVTLGDRPEFPWSQARSSQEEGFPSRFCFWKLPRALLPEQGPDRTACWGLPCSPALLQRSVV